MAQIITGFHAIEERVRRALENGKTDSLTIHCAKAGPRIKKIIETAASAGIRAVNCDKKSLDTLVQSLPEVARDHRGIVLVSTAENQKPDNEVDFDLWITEQKKSEQKSTVLILDSITDPHNIGAILRSCDQFGVSLVIMPSHRSANDFAENEIIARASAGASAYVPVAVVTNLVRAAGMLKNAGFWIYGADAGGQELQKTDFAAKTAIVMGSEGSGISHLLEQECDAIVSIPTCGKIDSLNVSVAAGVLLYELYRRQR